MAKLRTTSRPFSSEPDPLDIPDAFKATPERMARIAALPPPTHQLAPRRADQIVVRPREDQAKADKKSRYLPVSGGGFIDAKTGQEFCDWAAVVQSWGVKDKSDDKFSTGDFKKAQAKGEKRVDRGAVLKVERAPVAKKDDIFAGLKIEELLAKAKPLGYKEIADWPNGGVRVMRVRNFLRNEAKKEK